jgi:capsular polysaccharide biosynthesis protein
VKLRAFLAAVGRYWKTFVAVAAVVFAAGLAWVLLTPAKFVSTTQLMVSIAGSTTAAAYQNDEVVAGRVNSYIVLLTSDVVSQRVIDKLGLPMTAPEFAAKVSATNVPPKTTVIDVAVTDESSAQARLLADTLANEFISYARALETPTGEDGQKVRTTVVSVASEPSERRTERVILGVLAGLAALILGAVAVWIRSLIDPVVRTADRAAAAAGVPVIGSVTSAPVVAVDELEGYRRLRSRLRAVTKPIDEANDRGHVWLLAAAAGELDVAAVASNLGRVLELAGSRSVVLETRMPKAAVASEPTLDSTKDDFAEDGDNDGQVHDDNRPAAHRNHEANIETESNEGQQSAAAEPSIRRGADGFPDRLSVSAWARDPDLSATKAAAELFDRLRNEYTHVIVAAPPELTTITASIVSDSADGVLLVASLGKTRRRDLGRAADNLRATGAPLTGVVLSVAKSAPHVVAAAPSANDPVAVRNKHALSSDR